MTTCKGCGIILDGQDCRRVADWLFCTDCFQKLMDKSDEKPELAEQKDIGESAPNSGQECYFCKKNLGQLPFRRLGVWVFCEDCYSNLTARPVAFQKDEAVQPPSDGKTPETDAPKFSVHVQADIMKTVKCQNCGKKILERGGKHREDKILCPDCFYAVPDRNIPVAVPEKEPALTDKTVTDGEQDCGSCGRHVSKAFIKTVDGYFICQPCLTAGKELSLQIARLRHQNYLQSLKKQLES